MTKGGCPKECEGDGRLKGDCISSKYCDAQGQDAVVPCLSAPLDILRIVSILLLLHLYTYKNIYILNNTAAHG